MRTLQDIKNNPAIMLHLHWDLTPEQIFQPRMIRSKEDIERLDELHIEQAGFYFYVDVWNCSASLALMHVKTDGSMNSERIDYPDEDELIQAIEEAGGAINMSGHYPLSEKLKTNLMNLLEVREHETDNRIFTG